MNEARDIEAFRCKACSGFVVVFTDMTGKRLYGHTKPEQLLGTVGRVPCAAFRRCETWADFERDCMGEPIAPPDSMTEVRG